MLVMNAAKRVEILVANQHQTPTEMWLHIDGTVHRVRPDLLLDISALGVTIDARGLRQLPEWAGWTVARHLAHPGPAAPALVEPVQDALFADASAAPPS